MVLIAILLFIILCVVFPPVFYLALATVALTAFFAVWDWIMDKIFGEDRD
jgi:hypothetical protein